MYTLGEKVSLENYWADLVFVDARLTAEPSVRHLQAKLDPHLVSYESITRDERDLRRRKVLLRAQKATVVVRMDGYVSEIYAAALYEVKYKKKDARYKDLCTTSMSGLKKLTLSAQKEELEQMKMVLKKQQYSDAFREAQTRVIDQAIVEVDGVLAAEKELEEREMLHEEAVKAWKEGANTIRYEIYGELLQEPGLETRATAWARTFFMPPQTTKKLSAEEKAKLDAARAEKKQKRLEREIQENAEEVRKTKEKLEREQKKAAIDKGAKAGGDGNSSPPPEAPPEAPPEPESTEETVGQVVEDVQ